MTWLSTLLEWLGSWWPFSKVDIWERAMRYTYIPGHYKFFSVAERKLCWVNVPPRVIETELGPGMHRSVKWFEDTVIHTVVEDTFEMELQNITTKDNKSITFRIVGVYEVFNVSNATSKVEDYKRSMKNLAMIHMARVIRQQEWMYVSSNATQLEEALRIELHEKSKKWGVRIKEIGLTTLVRTRQINRFQTDQLNA